MISFRKTEANRCNARRSTGPRTRLGKLRISRNAVKHGLTSQPTHFANSRTCSLEDDLKAVSDQLVACRLRRGSILAAAMTGRSNELNAIELDGLFRTLELAIRYERDLLRFRRARLSVKHP